MIGGVLELTKTCEKFKQNYVFIYNQKAYPEGRNELVKMEKLKLSDEKTF